MAKYSQKMGGKEVGQANVYAEPHTMEGKKVTGADFGKPPKKRANNPNWVPLDGVAIGSNDEVKTSGIKIRGTGAATKGVMARGPMA